MDGEKAKLAQLVEIMSRLRAPDGCPWDRQQTFDTLKTYLVEEAYEVLEAIESGTPEQLLEELGDLLFQIVFQCQLAAEAGWFDIDDVVATISRKIIRRHPHVFASARADTPEQVVDVWERVKRQEKADAGQARQSVLDGLPAALPALLAAHRLSERASRSGFDWNGPEQVLHKVDEEMGELKSALDDDEGQARVHEELGDVLFALANLARHLDGCAEDDLREANHRFRRRFMKVEHLAQQRQLRLCDLSVEQLERLWQEAKSSLSRA